MEANGSATFSPAAQVKAILQKDEHLLLPYNDVKVAFFTPKTTFVPTRLYNPNEKAAYLAHVVAVQPEERLLADHLKGQNAQNVYAVDTALYDVMRWKFPSARMFHSSTVLLNQFSRLTDHSDFQLFMNVKEQYVQIFLYKSKTLLFSNIFRFRSSKDFVYFVLLVFDQFKLKPEQVPAIFSGELLENSEVYQLLNRYIPTLQRVAPPNYYTFNAEFYEQARHPHFYFDLYALEHCEE